MARKYILGARVPRLPKGVKTLFIEKFKMGPIFDPSFRPLTIRSMHYALIFDHAHLILHACLELSSRGRYGHLSSLVKFSPPSLFSSFFARLNFTAEVLVM